MFEDGPRGLNGPCQNGQDQGELDELEGGKDMSLYGVDWDIMDDEVLMEHHYQHNPIQGENGENPFSTTPATLSEVKCIPLTAHSRLKVLFSLTIILHNL